jgi:hypothetical protein
MPLSTRHCLRFAACALALSLASSGCEALQALSPQQMWKLNRQPNMDRGDAYFSVPAEVDAQSVEGDIVSKLEAPDLSSTTATAPSRVSDQG